MSDSTTPEVDLDAVSASLPTDAESTEPSDSFSSPFMQDPSFLLSMGAMQLDTAELMSTLVQVFDAKAWVAMGLVVNPSTGEAVKDMPSAQLAIDTVQFLLSKVESKFPETDRRDHETSESGNGQVDRAEFQRLGPPEDARDHEHTRGVGHRGDDRQDGPAPPGTPLGDHRGGHQGLPVTRLNRMRRAQAKRDQNHPGQRLPKYLVEKAGEMSPLLRACLGPWRVGQRTRGLAHPHGRLELDRHAMGATLFRVGQLPDRPDGDRLDLSGLVITVERNPLAADREAAGPLA